MTSALKRPSSAMDGVADASHASSKRPYVATPSASSGSLLGLGNGHADLLVDGEQEAEETPAYKGLEAYRKEAIYRHLLEARRDIAQAERRAQRLGQDLSAAAQSCQDWQFLWESLVQDLLRLSPSDAHLGAEKHLLLAQGGQAAPAASPTERCTALRAVLSRIINAGAKPDAQTAALSARIDDLASESAALRAQLSLAYTERSRLLSDVEELTAQLRRAERRADRLASPTIRKTERPKEEEELQRAALQQQQDEDQQRVETARAKQQASAAASASASTDANMAANGTAAAHLFQPNGMTGPVVPLAELEAEREALSNDVSEALREAEARLEEADGLRRQLVAAQEEDERLRYEMQRMPDERILETSLYRELHAHFQGATDEAQRAHRALEVAEAEATALRAQLLERSTDQSSEAQAQLDELRASLKAQEADVARLRGQRDDLSAELSERRQRENVKMTQIDEMKGLLNARQARIATLKSEVRRAHMVLAARAGDKVALERAKGSNSNEDDVALVEGLQTRLKTADETVADLKRQLDARSSSTTEADLIAKAAALQGSLDSLTALLDGATSSEEVQAKLAEQAKLRMELDAAGESTQALCEEVDRLSAAYADVEAIANGKTFDLVKFEDKILRLTTEKAKADNKYFGAMRAKDALDGERKMALKTAERQAKALERAQESDRQLTGQLAALEREVSLRRRAMDEQTTKYVEMEREAKIYRNREQEALRLKGAAEQRLAAVFPAQQDEARAAAREREARIKLERELEKVKAELARANAASASAPSASKRKGASTESDQQIDYLNSLLRCSACHDRYRDRILTKCLHTFCSACIDSRISTRQRKCPHCQSTFATSDVQQLFLQ